MVWVQLLFGKSGKRFFDVYEIVNETCNEVDQRNDCGDQINIHFFHFKSAKELGSGSCEYRNEEGYKADDDCKEQAGENHLCNGSVAGSCNLLGGCVNNGAVEVGSRSNENLREREYQTDNTSRNCIEGRHANGEVKHCYTADNRQRADDAAEKHLGEQKLRGFYREGFCFECRLAVSGDVGCTEGVGQNAEHQNNDERQRELKSAAKCVEDQSFKQRVAAVDHKRHCKRNGKVREKIFGFTVDRNEFFSKQAGRNTASETEAELCAALSAVAVSVKNETVKRAGDQERKQECRYGKSGRNEDRFLHIDAEQQGCECVCGIGVHLRTHQNVNEIAGEQELDRTRFKQSAQNVENARVNKERTHNENGQSNKGKEVSCAQELDNHHIRQDQKRCQKEGYHREQQINDGSIDQKIFSCAKYKVENGVNGNDQHKCRNVSPEQKSRELCTEDSAVLNRQTQKDRCIRASCQSAAHFFKAHNAKCHNDNGVNGVDELVRSCNRIAYLVHLYLKVTVGNSVDQDAKDAGDGNRKDDGCKDAENVDPLALRARKEHSALIFE